MDILIISFPVRRHFVLLLFALNGICQQPSDAWNREFTPGERIPYGTDALQFAELRVPSGKGPFPVAVLVHGGCWAFQLGTRDTRDTSYEPFRPIAAALA